MLKRLAILFFLPLIIIGCARKIPPPMPQKRVVTTSKYNAIEVNGDVNVNLHSGYYKHPKITVKGDAKDLKYVEVLVIGNKLVINRKPSKKRFAPVNIEIRAGRFDTFVYNGRGRINAPKLNLPRLAICIDNKGPTNIGGNVGLYKLSLKGKGPVDINGIRSKYLALDLGGEIKARLTGFSRVGKIIASDKAWVSMHWLEDSNLVVRQYNSSYVQLAGVVEKLDAEIYGDSCFKARYLRVDRAFVKTHGTSVAEISAINSQGAVALDASDIRFYNLPVMRADFMGNNGSVLDFRDWASPYIVQYDRYNS